MKELLGKMPTRGIIADVDQPTDCVTYVVITEKLDGSVSEWLDPEPLNGKIKREHHRLRTADGVLSKLAKKNFFTAIDERDAIWQFPLAKHSL